jgi:tetratricopeptide (TPR) repeat protein
MSIEEQLAKADELHMKEDVHGMYALLEELFKAHATNPDVIWRLARAHYLVAKEHTDDAAKREAHMRKGLELIQAAHAAKPEDPTVNKWSGILLGAMGEFIPTKEKIANAYKIRDFFLKGLAVKPDDATLQHCMGSWSFSVLQIGFLERQIASLIFGTPPSSTFEETERYLMKSYELDPKQTHNCLMLGDAYYWNRDWPSAKKFYLFAATECPTITAAAKKQAAEAKEKAAKC